MKQQINRIKYLKVSHAVSDGRLAYHWLCPRDRGILRQSQHPGLVFWVTVSVPQQHFFPVGAVWQCPVASNTECHPWLVNFSHPVSQWSADRILLIQPYPAPFVLNVFFPVFDTCPLLQSTHFDNVINISFQQTIIQCRLRNRKSVGMSRHSGGDHMFPIADREYPQWNMCYELTNAKLIIRYLSGNRV